MGCGAAVLHRLEGPQRAAPRARGLKQGLKLSEYGVFRVEDEERLAAATEEDVYAQLGLPWILPTLREDRGEIEAARAGDPPRRR